MGGLGVDMIIEPLDNVDKSIGFSICLVDGMSIVRITQQSAFAGAQHQDRVAVLDIVEERVLDTSPALVPARQCRDFAGVPKRQFPIHSDPNPPHRGHEESGPCRPS